MKNSLKNIEHLESVHKQSCNPKVYRKLQEERKKLEVLKILCAPKNGGGEQALPDLRKYYNAAILLAFLKRHSASYVADWKDLMAEPFLPFLFKEVIWQAPAHRQTKFQPSPLNNTILLEWDKFKKLNLPESLLLRAFLGQKWFLPGLDFFSFQTWRRYNLILLWDV